MLTWANTRGLEYGKWVQNLFTVAKTGALIAVIVLACTLGWNASAVKENFGDLWSPRGTVEVVKGLTAASRCLPSGLNRTRLRDLSPTSSYRTSCFDSGSKTRTSPGAA